MCTETVSGDLFVLIQAAMFAILCAVIYHSLKRSPFDENSVRCILAVAASLLAVVALKRQLRSVMPVGMPTSTSVETIEAVEPTPVETADDGMLDVVLLPYAALAIAVPLVLMLWLFDRWKKKHDEVRHRSKATQSWEPLVSKESSRKSLKKKPPGLARSQSETGTNLKVDERSHR